MRFCSFCAGAARPRVESSAFDRAMLLIIAATIAASITLHNAPFHAVIADPESCIARRDIHRLTGTINVSSSGTGGGASALSVHDDNGTLPDYTLHIAAGKGVERKITAALNCKNVTANIGGSARIVGTLTQLEFLQKGNIVAIFIQGPNKPAPPPPPPIPPPPPACSTEGAANQSACDAVPPRGGTGPACAWCGHSPGLGRPVLNRPGLGRLTSPGQASPGQACPGQARPG